MAVPLRLTGRVRRRIERLQTVVRAWFWTTLPLAPPDLEASSRAELAKAMRILIRLESRLHRESLFVSPAGARVLAQDISHQVSRRVVARLSRVHRTVRLKGFGCYYDVTELNALIAEAYLKVSFSTYHPNFIIFFLLLAPRAPMRSIRLLLFLPGRECAR